MTGAAFKYRAFISYSHADHAWGTWLHRGLERFRMPQRLAGNAPRKLGRCFRDEAEMGAAAHLPEKIAQALAASDWLVVICSPRSAMSPWVNKEIADFRALGRGDRVLALVVDGKPGGTAADGKDRQCFPAALRVDADGNVVEPLAVDVRKFGRADALVRLVSEIMGVEYDALREREVRRRRWARAVAGALFATGLLLTAGALAGGYFAAANYAASSAARSALFAREARQLLEEKNHVLAALVALEGDPMAKAGAVESWFNPDGYAPARAALQEATAENKLIASRMLAGGKATKVIVHPDGERFLVGFEDGSAQLWRFGVDGAESEAGPANGPVSAMAFSPDGGMYLVASEEIERLDLMHHLPCGKLRLMKTGQREPLRDFGDRLCNVTAVAFLPDGERFLTGDLRGGLMLWRVGQEEPVRKYTGQDGGVNAIDFFADGVSFAAGGTYAAGVWGIDYEAPERTLPNAGQSVVTIEAGETAVELPAQTVAASADQRYLLLGQSGGAGAIVSLDSDSITARFGTDRPGGVTAYSLHPDHARFIVGAEDGEIQFWWLDEADLSDSVAAHGAPVTGVTFLPDGERFVSVSEEGELRLWRFDMANRFAHEGDGGAAEVPVMPPAQEQVRAACRMLREIGVMDFAKEDWAKFPILDRAAPHPCRDVWGRDPRRGAAGG